MTQVMAILNVTPDSFSDGGQLASEANILRAAETAIQQGASILDVGGESTRPGSEPVPVAEELQRVLPVVSALHHAFPTTTISIDTRKSPVAEAALQVGATMVNDVSGLMFDSNMASVVAKHRAQVVIMHALGTPQTMQQNPHYPQGVVHGVIRFFKQQVDVARQAGVDASQIILDPGVGFGKTVSDNLLLLKHLDQIKALGYPVLVGTSRKSFLTLGNPEKIPPQDREALTAASLAMAIQNGADIVRIHAVETHAPVLQWLNAYLQVT